MWVSNYRAVPSLINQLRMDPVKWSGRELFPLFLLLSGSTPDLCSFQRPGPKSARVTGFKHLFYESR